MGPIFTALSFDGVLQIVASLLSFRQVSILATAAYPEMEMGILKILVRLVFILTTSGNFRL